MEEKNMLESFNNWGDVLNHFSKAVSYLESYKNEIGVVSERLKHFETGAFQIDPNLPRHERKRTARVLEKFVWFRKSLETHVADCANSSETIRKALEALGELFKLPSGENLS
jgi:hypothetical protein